jgi:hypothetical protein
MPCDSGYSLTHWNRENNVAKPEIHEVWNKGYRVQTDLKQLWLMNTEYMSMEIVNMVTRTKTSQLGSNLHPHRIALQMTRLEMIETINQSRKMPVRCYGQ